MHASGLAGELRQNKEVSDISGDGPDNGAHGDLVEVRK